MRSGMRVELDRVVVADKFVVGTWRRLIALVFDGNLDMTALELLRLRSDEWLEAHPGRTVDIAIVQPSATQMDDATRKMLALVIKDHQDNRNAAATVILATGLRGALHRSVVTAVNMMAPPPYPGRVFGAVDDALDWLSPYIVELCGEAPLVEIAAELDALGADLEEAREKPERESGQ